MRLLQKNLYNSFVQKLITKGDALFASESLPFILDELKKTNYLEELWLSLILMSLKQTLA